MKNFRSALQIEAVYKAHQENYLGKTLLEAFIQIVSSNRYLRKAYLYVWPGWGTDLEINKVPKRDAIRLITPTNQNLFVAEMEREQILAKEELINFIHTVEKTDFVSLCTRVQLEGNVTQYIPMIDVKVTHSAESLAIITRFIQEVFYKFEYNGDFLIFASSNSYYLVGTQTFDLTIMLEFMAFSSLSRFESGKKNPTLINDLEFVGYTLLKKFDNGLRITANTAQAPTVIKVIKRKINATGKRMPLEHYRKETI